MFSLFLCVTWFFSYMWLFIENILLEAKWRKSYWESTIFPRSAISPVVNVSGSIILLAGGLQRGPGVVITVRKGVNYLEDQNRRYDEDKMLPLLCRILILRKISSEYVSNNEGQKLSSWWPQKLPVCKFSILYFDRSTGTSSSLSTKMTFTLKMTTFWVFSNAKGWYFFFAIIIHFRCKL